MTKLNFLSVSLILYFMNHSFGGVIKKENLFNVDIIHYNDFHDRYEETSVIYPTYKTNDSNCLGGIARLSYAINDLLKEKPDALVLNAGDTYLGTYWYSLLQWEPTSKFMNLLPNDAIALGNHEFDGHVAGLLSLLTRLKAPVVAANIDTSQEPSLNGLYRPYIIVEKQGKKLGIIGLVTTVTQIISNPDKVKFLDPIETSRKYAQNLTDQGVNMIIILSHCGLDLDKEIAKRAGENIDIIVGGHSHSLLWNGKESPTNETISGPYPIIVEADSKPEHKVLIVTASCYTKYLGNIRVRFDDQGEMESFDGNPVFLNRSIPEDPAILAELEPFKEMLRNMSTYKIVGHAEDDLLENSCGFKECALGNLVADSMLDTAEKYLNATYSQVAFLHRNMIRGSLGKGDIKKGEVINALPFKNKVCACVLKGEYLLEAIEFSMNRTDQEHAVNPFFPHIAGMRLTLNTTKPKGQRVVAFSINENSQYFPLELNKEYLLITMEFLLNGGNGMTMLTKHCRDKSLLGHDADLVVSYLEKVKNVTTTLDNRTVVLN